MTPSLLSLSTCSGPGGGDGGAAIRGAGVGLASVGIGGTVTIMTIVVGVDAGAVADDGASPGARLHAAPHIVRQSSNQAVRHLRSMPEMLRHNGASAPRHAPGRTRPAS